MRRCQQWHYHACTMHDHSLFFQHATPHCDALCYHAHTSVAASSLLVELGRCASHGTGSRSNVRRRLPSDISQHVSLKANSHPSDSSTSKAGCSMVGS